MLRGTAVVLVAVSVAAASGCGRRLFGSARGDHAPDDMFLQFAAMQAHDVIDLSEVAVHRGTSQAVRSHARDLMTDQGAALDRITRVAEQRHTSLPSQSDTRHGADVQRLNAVSADKFDREYLTLMVSDHEFILSCYEDRARTAHTRAVRVVASDTVPVLQRDLDRTRGLVNLEQAAATPTGDPP